MSYFKNNRFYQYFDEFNYGIKDNYIAKLYPVVYFIRRALLCILVTIGFEAHPNIELGFFLGLEVAYSAVIFFVNPFKSIQDNFVILLNCFMMLFYII
jgi:hypothetical protein